METDIMKYSEYAFIENIQKENFGAYSMQSRNDINQFEGFDEFHKLIFISGSGEIRIENKLYTFEGPVLMITKPGIHSTWSVSNMKSPSYICRYNENFLNHKDLNCLKKWDKHFTKNPVLGIEPNDEAFIRSIFYRLTDEQARFSRYKSELAENKICIITHLALRMMPVKCSTSSALHSFNHSAVSLELMAFGFPPSEQVLYFN
jgi:hypothetical protein